ncbi:MAG: hypothetical protein IPJ01_11825 [Micavibrio sp.]|nr:hypothetical protein [Micavibrio sp.]
MKAEIEIFDKKKLFFTLFKRKGKFITYGEVMYHDKGFPFPPRILDKGEKGESIDKITFKIVQDFSKYKHKDGYKGKRLDIHFWSDGSISQDIWIA